MANKKHGIISDLWFVVKKEKKWWLIPLLLILFALVGVMMLAGSAGPLAPFIYPFL